ncbi:hypothetical protein, partial [Paramuribaculum intestinale]
EDTRQRGESRRVRGRAARQHREERGGATWAARGGTPAHPAGGRGGGIAGRIGRKKSRAIGVSEFPYTIAPML